MDKYPQLFNEDNFENLRVIVKEGEVISHVGMTEQWLSVFGCLLRVACIGAVCTHPDHRMQGLATKLFNDACEKAYADGVDFMMVSGGRGLYLRADCRTIVGCDFEVQVKPENRSLLKNEDLTIEPCSRRNLSEMAAIYRREPVRFIRRLEDYRWAYACRHVMDRQSDFLMVKKAGSLRAYVIIPRPDEEKRRVRISEYAGERVSIVNSLGLILQLYDLEEITLRIPGYDALMKSLMEERGFQLIPTNSAGTLRIINFTQLMERMRPYYEEVIGYKKARMLSFHEEDGTFLIEYDSEKLTIPNRANAVQLLFGSKDISLKELTTSRRLKRLLKNILPFPVPWYGINFV